MQSINQEKYPHSITQSMRRKQKCTKDSRKHDRTFTKKSVICHSNSLLILFYLKYNTSIPENISKHPLYFTLSIPDTLTKYKSR